MTRLSGGRTLVFANYILFRLGWCFWINLPLGGITIATVIFLVHPPPRNDKKHGTIIHALEQFDILGNIFFIPATVSLLLVLEWGGVQYQWSDWRIIFLLCIFGVCILVWLFVQYRQGDKATLPLRIIKMRSMACGVWYTFCICSLLYIFLAYVAVWFQTVRNVSAFQTGINFLTITVAQSVSLIMSGFLVRWLYLLLRHFAHITNRLHGLACADKQNWLLRPSNDYLDGALLRCLWPH